MPKRSPEQVQRTRAFPALCHVPGGRQQVSDPLTVEAVLHIKVNGTAYTTTVRTPGDDIELARGLVFTEGVIVDRAAPLAFRVITDHETGLIGCLEITVDPRYLVKDLEGRRTQMVSASCGLCGIRDPRELRMEGPRVTGSQNGKAALAGIPRLMEIMRARQPVFGDSGGCHGAAAFSEDGSLLCVFEDIGRHNAVDKVIGYLIGAATLDHAWCLAVSGRLSYEIVFKAYQARIPHIAAVSAPSTLAVEMAQRFGITLAAFCRDDRYTLYTNIPGQNRTREEACSPAFVPVPAEDPKNG